MWMAKTNKICTFFH